MLRKLIYSFCTLQKYNKFDINNLNQLPQLLSDFNQKKPRDFEMINQIKNDLRDNLNQFENDDFINIIEKCKIYDQSILDLALKRVDSMNQEQFFKLIDFYQNNKDYKSLKQNLYEKLFILINEDIDLNLLVRIHKYSIMYQFNDILQKVEPQLINKDMPANLFIRCMYNYFGYNSKIVPKQELIQFFTEYINSKIETFTFEDIQLIMNNCKILNINQPELIKNLLIQTQKSLDKDQNPQITVMIIKNIYKLQPFPYVKNTYLDSILNFKRKFYEKYKQSTYYFYNKIFNNLFQFKQKNLFLN